MLREEDDSQIKRELRGDITKFKEILEEIDNKLEEVENNMRKNKEAIEEYEEYLELIEDLPKFIEETPELDELNDVMQNIVLNCEVANKEVTKIRLKQPFRSFIEHPKMESVSGCRGGRT